MPNNINGFDKLNNLNTLNKPNKGGNETSEMDFEKMLKDSIGESNAVQKKSEDALADMATGQVKDLHQAAISIGKAETNMKMMLEVRNKAITAYKELLKTQI
ncbi:MAG: flagellar hook-basal body complex protein FliE [Campylobacterota bacterium]